MHDTFWDLAKDFGVTDALTDLGTEAGLKESVAQELGESEGVELSSLMALRRAGGRWGPRK